MLQDVAFDEPVVIHISDLPIRTVDQAAQIMRSHLREKFTMQRLNILLVLERAAEGVEIAEARQAFCSWALNERPVSAV